MREESRECNLPLDAPLKPAQKASLIAVWGKQMENLSEAVNRFLGHCRVGRGLSANTLRAYSIDLARFVAFAGSATVLADMGRDMLRDYASALFEDGLKTTSIKRCIASLKAMFRWLARDEAIEASPFHRLDLVVRLPCATAPCSPKRSVIPPLRRDTILKIE